MTEQQWLVSEDPAWMVHHLVGGSEGLEGNRSLWQTSERKFRLFAVAVSRALGMDTPSRLAAVEAWADGGPKPWHDVFSYEIRNPVIAAERVAAEAFSLAYVGEVTPQTIRMAKAIKVGILREMFGNPFRPVSPKGFRVVGPETMLTLHPGPLATPTVVSLAQAAYEDRDPQTGHLDSFRLSLLADALEEAGCVGDKPCVYCQGKGVHEIGYVRCDMDGIHDSRQKIPCVACQATGTGPHPLLAHLRSPGPHVRGCWAIDLILDKD